MPRAISRRQFAQNAATLALTALVPRGLVQGLAATKRFAVRTEVEIGAIHPELHGQFAGHLGSCVYGGLWVGKNSPIPNVNGYRRQAIEYLSELGIPVLRWPGGCFADDYHWRDGIGPAERRPKRVNIHWGGYAEDNSFGTHEFIGLCRLIDAQPYLAGNVGSGSPSELRDWIEYCNLPSGSTLSDERAANGSPDPFAVRYWGVGNESWGCGGEMRPEEYAAEFRRFAVYLRTFGGTKPFLIASGPNGNDANWSHGLIGNLNGHMPDGFAMHFYSGGADYPTRFTAAHVDDQLSSFARIEQAVIQKRALLDGYGGGNRVALLLDEWGVWDNLDRDEQNRLGRLWQQITMRSAVAAGLGLNLFNRNAEKLFMCNIAQMVNVLHSLLFTDGPQGEHCIRTVAYHAFSLFKAHRSKMAIRVESDDSAPLGVSASASKGEGQLIASFVNPRTDADWAIDCELKGVNAKAATGQILHDSDWNACNSFDNPDRIIPRPLTAQIEGGRLRFDLPKMSVATIAIQTS